MLIFKEKFRNSKVYYIGKYKGVININKLNFKIEDEYFEKK